MGARLAAYYAEAEVLAGLDGKIHLAMLTRIPSTRALVEPDSTDNIAKFEHAINALRKSRGGSHGPLSTFPSSTLFSERVSTGTHRSLNGGEELFWGVLGSLHDSMVAVYERDGRCALAWESRSLEKRYPCADGTRSVRETLSREIGVRFLGELQTVFEAATAWHGELTFDLHGHAASFSVTFSAGHDESGRVLGVNAFIQDITDQKRHEEQIALRESRLREHTRVYVDLLASKSSWLSDFGSALRRVTEAARSTLRVARASVWLYDETKKHIVCADLYDGDRHSHGLTLSAVDHPAYFAALREERAIAAHEALEDSRTIGFADGYLRPLGITSMLDVPIWVSGDMAGVVCHEHVGEPRRWTVDDESFAYMMASFVSLARERDLLKP